jgi:hypothetical protein
MLHSTHKRVEKRGTQLKLPLGVLDALMGTVSEPNVTANAAETTIE